MNEPVRDDSYNYIYCELVDDPDDILGIIAYSFYKQQKIEFFQAFHEKNSRAPSEDELKTFYITSNSPASLASYRTKADALTQEFVNTVLGEQISEIQAQSDRELTTRIKSLRPNFWNGVAQNIFASVLFVLLIGLVMFFTWSLKYGPVHVIEQMAGVSISEKATKPEPQGAQQSK
jgi:hypothetical protein